MRDYLDSEEAARQATGAMAALVQLVANSEDMIDARPFADLLGIVFDAAKKAMPHADKPEPRPHNDLI